MIGSFFTYNVEKCIENCTKENDFSIIIFKILTCTTIEEPLIYLNKIVSVPQFVSMQNHHHKD